MFFREDFSDEEKEQVSFINGKLSTLRSYKERIKGGEPIPDSEIKSLTKDILDNVVPLAERLGMPKEQKELQDTCIELAYPEDYKMLKKLLLDSEAMCEIVFKTFALPIKSMIDDLGIEFDFQYRMKSVYSIWRKMKIDHKEFDDVYDLFATRIVYKVPVLSEAESNKEEGIRNKEPKPLNADYTAVKDLKPEGATPGNINLEQLYCWRIYNVIAMLYRIHPDRIKNWITHPKPSGYQALQLTVMGPDCNWIEIQIRSERMDYEAEQGSAAHWLYKAETAAEASKAL